MTQPDRATARRLAQESLTQGDATGWFDVLYDVAQGDETLVPWADMTVNPHFVSWPRGGHLASQGKRALVIGCGLGDDAEELERRGYSVTAFDISQRAIDWCRRRFPQTRVDYCAADLLHPPAGWKSAFDFVLEVYTLQVLPAELRAKAIARMAEFVAQAGTLLLVARGREHKDDPGAMPWPLTKDELLLFNHAGLESVSLEDYLDDETPPVRRFRAEYRRPA